MTKKDKLKTAGIIGGMGPEATVDLMHRIISHTKAADDQDHVRCLVDQNPKVPSRIGFLVEGGNVSPGPCMADMARGLEKAGADFLCIPCNTAHNWYGEVAAAVSIPVLNIIELAAAAAASQMKDIPADERVAGILATPGTRITGLYEEPCRKLGMTAIYPDADMEKQLLAVIKSIKAGDTGPQTKASLVEVARHVENKGARALILACTELGIVGVDSSLPVVDAVDALAIAVVKEAGGTLA